MSTINNTINEDQDMKNNNALNNSISIIQNSLHQNLKQKRNTIEISKLMFHEFFSYNELVNKDMDCNNSFSVNITEIKNKMYKYEFNNINYIDINLQRKLSFIDISKKNVEIPLYKDIEIFNKEPFNNNLIIMNRDFDVESRENSIIIAQEYVLKELNYGILSFRQRQYNF